MYFEKSSIQYRGLEVLGSVVIHATRMKFVMELALTDFDPQQPLEVQISASDTGRSVHRQGAR